MGTIHVRGQKSWTMIRLEPRQKGLRDRNSPTCTLSQNGYGTPFGGQMGPPNLLAEIGFGV